MPKGILFYIAKTKLGDHLPKILLKAEEYAAGKGKICSGVVTKNELPDSFRLIANGSYPDADEVCLIRIKRPGCVKTKNRKKRGGPRPNKLAEYEFKNCEKMTKALLKLLERIR